MVKLPPPIPMLADHKKTMAYLMEMAGENAEEIAEVEEWGRQHQRRTKALRRFVAFLEQNDILVDDGKMRGIIAEFAVEQCFAIATKYGLDDMGYKFHNNRSGALTGDMPVALQAIGPLPTERQTGLFASPEDEAEFLDTVRYKDVFELGRMANAIVLTNKRRIYA